MLKWPLWDVFVKRDIVLHVSFHVHFKIYDTALGTQVWFLNSVYIAFSERVSRLIYCYECISVVRLHFLIKNYWANLCQTWFVAPIDHRYWDRVQSCLIAHIKVFQLEIYFFFTMMYKQPSVINPQSLVPKEIVRISEADYWNVVDIICSWFDNISRIPL